MTGYIFIDNLILALFIGEYMEYNKFDIKINSMTKIKNQEKYSNLIPTTRAMQCEVSIEHEVRLALISNSIEIYRYSMCGYAKSNKLQKIIN